MGQILIEGKVLGADGVDVKISGHTEKSARELLEAVIDALPMANLPKLPFGSDGVEVTIVQTPAKGVDENDSH